MGGNCKYVKLVEFCNTMKKISSSFTFFYKKIFPVIWFGFLSVFLLIGLMSDLMKDGDWSILIIPCIMGLFGFFMMKAYVWDLCDEVYDCGDYLQIKKGSETANIFLAAIINVNTSMASKPPRISLRLDARNGFGDEISFIPLAKTTFNPFAKRNKIADDLMTRVDKARRIYDKK